MLLLLALLFRFFFSGRFPRAYQHCVTAIMHDEIVELTVMFGNDVFRGNLELMIELQE